MNRTGIEYLDYSWNPLAMHCTPVSAGCARCWHLTMTKRLAGNPAISVEARAAYAGDAPPLLIEERLGEPLSLKKGSRIGVQFMGDLFCKDVPFEYVAEIEDVMSSTPQHTYMLLTKRPDRMLEWVTWMANEGAEMPSAFVALGDNIWLGTTVENPDQLWRILVLLQIPAAVRFVSVEPMLGPVDFARWLPGQFDGTTHTDHAGVERYDLGGAPVHPLDWVICGAETGPGARPMDRDWAYSLKDQCWTGDIPFFFKKDSAGNRTLDGRLWEQSPEVTP